MSRSVHSAARWMLVALLALVAVRQLVSTWRFALAQAPGDSGDIAVYIGALEHLSAGGALYEFTLDGGRYGFTYPPFAAVVLRPLTWLDPSTTGRLWLTFCLAVAAAIVVLVVRTRSWPTTPPGRVAVLSLALTAFLGSVQVQSDLITGQVNLVLAVLVLLDVGRFVPDRSRGAFVGVAAAVKLTPMVVWGWFATTRQWRALVTSVGTFATCGVLAAIVLPDETRTFWTRAVFETERVGDVELRFNSSVMGILARAGIDGTARTALWLVVGGLVVLVAFWHAQRARRAGDHVAAAVLLGCAAVIATPIAWPHHQIWLPLAGIVLATRDRWVPRLAGLLVVAFAYLHTPVIRWSDAHGTGWLLDNLDAAMLIGVCLFGLGPGRPARQPEVATARETTSIGSS